MSNRSKKLSYLLRHKPEAKGLSLDKEGWISFSELTDKTDFTDEELLEINASDAKGRYSVKNEDEDFYIRANQGHSTSSVELTFEKAIPPVILYHGTPISNLDTIMKKGLLPMKRHHVHLSSDESTAQIVGSRGGKRETILRVDAKQMFADGIQFYISENGVYLVDSVPPKYLIIFSRG